MTKEIAESNVTEYWRFRSKNVTSASWEPRRTKTTNFIKQSLLKPLQQVMNSFEDFFRHQEDYLLRFHLESTTRERERQQCKSRTNKSKGKVRQRAHCHDLMEMNINHQTLR